MIGGADGRHEEDATAALDEAKIELIVLVPEQIFVEHPNPVEHGAWEASKRYGIHPPWLRGADAEIRIPHAKGVGQGDRDRSRTRRVARRHGDADAPHVVGSTKK